MLEHREVPHAPRAERDSFESLDTSFFPSRETHPLPLSAASPEPEPIRNGERRSERRTIEPEIDLAHTLSPPDRVSILDTVRNASYVLLARLFPVLNPWAEGKLLHPGFSAGHKEDLKPGLFKESLTEGFIEAPGKVNLHYWHVKAKEGKPTVVISHGNGGNLMECEPLFEPLLERGYGVLTYDYRGYGKSTGKPSEKALYEDLEAVTSHLESTGVERSEQVLLGFSYGTAVTVDIASRSNVPFKAVLLLAPMTSSPEVFKFRIENELPPSLSSFLRPFADRFEQLIDSESKIHEISSPLLIVHGTSDPVVPHMMGERLFELATRASSRTFISVTGAGHNDILYSAAKTIAREVDEMIGRGLEEEGAEEDRLAS